MNNRLFQDPDTVIPGRVVDWQVGKDVTDRRIFDILRQLNNSKSDRRHTVLNITSAYVILASDDTIYGDVSAGSFSVTLPTAVGVSGITYTVKKIDTSVNTLTVATIGGQTIDGSTSAPIIVPMTSLDLRSDGTNWEIV